MPATIKYEQVALLKEKLEKSVAVFVGEYRGMTVAQSTPLRAKVREAGGELKIAKNTLFAIAMKEAGLEALPESVAVGPNVYALCYKDPVAIAKILSDYASEKTQKAFILKGGLLGRTALSAAQIQALANLPPKDILIGQVVRTIAAPLTGLVTVLSGTIRGLVTCLDQIREQKEKAA
ncbi:MAG: 50S ribosomal protein L10 [Synergistaceae bacterium]|jgi:large subunit ribosomal protein L10|nr:50S ribosomal protein L10 [Synergistaceae bacterium]